MLENESRQSSNIVWAILASVLGVFAIGGQKSSTDDAASTSKNGSREARIEAGLPIASGGGPLDPLDDFFALDSRRKHPFTGRARLTNRDRELALINRYEREYLIVTVPDPMDSQFGYGFDELMDSIQRALEIQDYVIDRAWLPWELDKRKPVRTKIMTDWRELAVVLFPCRGGQIGEGSTSFREENPGTLLFRAKSANPNFLGALRIVFLVGENPTSGIDKRALARAIELIGQDQPARLPFTIRIVGPYFTGSETSLRLVLHDPIHQKITFHVISGAAMGVTREDFCTHHDERITFQATINPTKKVLPAILHFLEQRDRSRSDDCDFTCSPDWLSSVALLTESNTGFGQDSIGASSQYAGVLELHFPLHMAWLRSRYEEARRRRDEKLNLPDSDSLVPRLGNKTPNQDSISLQDPDTTTSANGEVLQNILSIIRRQQIRYVGIIATDPRDQIMLASAIRDNCPGVQIFFIGSDRLLTLPEYSYSLKGTLIGSTYPLAPMNQFRTNLDKPPRLFFPSEWAQGYYNAILAQTGGDNHLIGYRPPLLSDVTNAQALESRRPPVWISMIGQNGDLVPLQFFANLEDDPKGYVWPGPAVQTMKKKIKMAFPTTLVVLTSLCLLSLFVAGHALRLRPLLFWESAATDALHRWEKCFYRCCCLLSLTVLLLPFVYLFWLALWGVERSRWDELQLVLFLLMLVGFFVFAAAAFEPSYFRWCAAETSPLQGQPSSRQAYYGIFLGVFVVFLAGWYLYLGTALTSWQAMFLERALNLTTGVSPLLPLIFVCLALFWWFCCQLRRLDLADRVTVGNPFPKQSLRDYQFDKITELNDLLQNENRSSVEFVKNNLSWFLGLVVMMILGAVWIGCLYLPTVEGRLWTGLFMITFTLGFFLVAVNLLRFWLIWRRVRKLLHTIAILPMARAFSQLPLRVRAVFSSTLPLGRAQSRVHKSTFHIAYHQIGLLNEETERLLQDPPFYQDTILLPLLSLKSVDARIRPLLNLKPILAEYDPQCDLAENAPEPPAKKISKLAQTLLPTLTSFWPERSLKDAFGDSENVQEDEKNQPVFQRWVEMAEDFIAIQVVIYLSQFFFHMRNLIWSMTVCGTLLLLGSTSYPFQPERLLLTLLLSLLGAVLAGIVYVLVLMNRDELLSCIARSTPNRFTLDWDFVSSVLTYVVPMGTVIVLQMSGAFRFLLEPLVRLVR